MDLSFLWVTTNVYLIFIIGWTQERWSNAQYRGRDDGGCWVLALSMDVVQSSHSSDFHFGELEKRRRGSTFSIQSLPFSFETDIYKCENQFSIYSLKLCKLQFRQNSVHATKHLDIRESFKIQLLREKFLFLAIFRLHLALVLQHNLQRRVYRVG